MDIEDYIEDVGKNIILSEKIFSFTKHPRDLGLDLKKREWAIEFKPHSLDISLICFQLQQFMNNWWVLHPWEVPYYPQRQSGRREGLSGYNIDDPSFPERMILPHSMLLEMDQKEGHRLLNWFDLYSSFRDEDVPEVIFDACLGEWPTEVSANALYYPDMSAVELGTMGVKIGDVVYEMPAPPKHPDAPLIDRDLDTWFPRYLIEQICDPVFSGVNAFSMAPERFPALKRVFDASKGYERAFFFDRLISERFAEAMLREAETGFPLRICVAPYSCGPGGDYTNHPFADENGDIPYLDETAPMNLSWRLFNTPGGGPGWIQRYTAFPAIKDQMRGLAPIGDA